MTLIKASKMVIIYSSVDNNKSTLVNFYIFVEKRAPDKVYTDPHVFFPTILS